MHLQELPAIAMILLYKVFGYGIWFTWSISCNYFHTFSGLCLSVGVILYISSINDELSFQQSKDCYEFKYQYSWSFYLVGISFVMEETSAVISIKLYLERNFHKLDMMLDILPGLDAKLNEESTCLKRLDSQSQTLIW